MIARFLTLLILFLLPLILYLLYASFIRKHLPKIDGIKHSKINVNYIPGLLLLGVFLVALLLGFEILQKGNDPHGQYTPPRYEDGVIKPSTVQPSSPSQQN